MKRLPTFVALALAALCGCKTPEAGQGGARFIEAKAPAPRVSVEAMYEICWERHAQGQVTLQFLPDGSVFFEAQGGASNSTGRCVREIAATYPHAKRPEAPQVVKAPGQAASGWAWLEWARLLSSSRYGPERGLLDAAPLVSACLQRGLGLRQGAVFEVEPAPVHEVRTLANDGRPGAFSDTEKCIDAVLGAAVWPSSRPGSFGFERRGAPAPQGDVALYFHEGPPLPALDPNLVHEALAAIGPAVAACWEAALVRRPGLGGGRSIRLRTDASGLPERVTFVGNLSQSPRTASDHLLDRCLFAAVKGGVRVQGGGAGETAYSWVFAAR